MKNILPSLKASSVVSAIVVIPFIIMELINANQSFGSFPFVLFATLWIVALFFFLILFQLIRHLRSADMPRNNYTRFFIGVPVLAFLAWFWVMVVIDQMPCFLGIPNCD